MQLRHKKSQELCTASNFNSSALNEIIVYFTDDCDSDYPRNYDVKLTRGPRAGQWVDLTQAFKDHDVITDNFNRHFFEPDTFEDRERGYTLDGEA